MTENTRKQLLEFGRKQRGTAGRGTKKRLHPYFCHLGSSRLAIDFTSDIDLQRRDNGRGAEEDIDP